MYCQFSHYLTVTSFSGNFCPRELSRFKSIHLTPRNPDDFVVQIPISQSSPSILVTDVGDGCW